MFRWLKPWMPRSLYARALLILLLPVLTLQLVIFVSFLQRHFEGVTRQMTGSVLLELRYLIDETAAAENLGPARAVDVGSPLGLAVDWPVQPPPAIDGRRFYDLSGVTVAQVLALGLPEMRGLQFDGNDAVSVWLDLPQGLMRVTFDRARVSATNPHQLLVVMVFFGALMTVIAYFFLRNQLRPIARLATAASAFGKGRRVPFEPGGAVEVRAAGTAFVAMRNRIERQTSARTMMLSGVSHDLRTPLTRLKLGLSMIDDPEAAALVRDVDEMQKLIDGFLDFARGDAEDDLGPEDPVALVCAAVADAQRAGLAAEVGEIRGIASLGGPEPLKGTVPLKGTAIRRALDNLIGNALRYGTRAVVSIVVGERSIRFTVEDDGPGIDPAAREEAMRPFTRLDPARNQDRGSGVGLGLAIVADIARAHGGTLRLGESVALGGLRADLVLAL